MTDLSRRNIGPANRGYLHRRCIALPLLLLLLIPAPGVEGDAQPVDHALMLGVGTGLTLYHGEFNSLQDPFSPIPGTTFSASLQYNISRVIAFGGRIAASTLCYGIDPFARTKYASNFFGPAEAVEYPGSNVRITESNDISTTSFYLYGKVYLDGILPTRWTLFGFGGIGMIGFTPKNGDGDQLPKNLTGPYDETSLMIPFGGGAEYRVTEKLRAYAEYTFHSGFSDYLDGYGHFLDYETSSVPSGPGLTPTQSDHHSTLRVGLTYQIYRNAPDPVPPRRSTPSGPSGDRPTGDDTPLGDEDPDEQESERDRPPSSRSASRAEAQSSETATPEPPPAHRRVENADQALRTPETSEEQDSDGDLLSDREETEVYGTDPLSPDSDADGLDDGEEVRLYATDPLAADSDGDLLSDLSEVRYHGTSPRTSDTDRDRLGDNEEISRYGTDPLAADSDGDGVIDGEDDCPLEPGTLANRGCPGGEEESRVVGSGTPENDLPRLEAGVRREFSNIYFRQNSDEFDFSRPETRASLDALREFLASCDEVGVLIEGHTSSEGNPEWNMTLSKMRADRVRRWLVEEGVASSKILGTIGYGSRLPKILEPSPSQISAESLERVRAQNRRITTLLRIPCS